MCIRVYSCQLLRAGHRYLVTARDWSNGDSKFKYTAATVGYIVKIHLKYAHNPIIAIQVSDVRLHVTGMMVYVVMCRHVGCAMCASSS